MSFGCFSLSVIEVVLLTDVGFDDSHLIMTLNSGTAYSNITAESFSASSDSVIEVKLGSSFVGEVGMIFDFIRVSDSDNLAVSLTIRRRQNNHVHIS